jgi:hypothetical protein
LLRPQSDTQDAVQSGFLESSWPVYLILGSFFTLTIPLSLLAAGDPDFLLSWSPGLVYLCVLGITHFILTFVVYFQVENRRYYRSTLSNRLTFFVAPVAIFLFFDLYDAFNVAVALPWVNFALLCLVRLLDFQHFTRQCFGVQQLFRIRSRARFPDWMKQAENHHFTALAVLMLLTYIGGGRFRPDLWISWILLAIVACLLAWNLTGFAITWRRGAGASRLAAPLAYLLLQTTAAGLAAFSTSLYAFALAMHYVEYHLLMVPRCFSTKLDDVSRGDRWFGRLRRHRILFYALLILAAVPITRFASLGMAEVFRSADASRPIGYRMLISIFDGLFVTHYLIEARIWKFGEPFYRRTLLPLYLSTSPPRAIVVAQEGAPVAHPRGEVDRVAAPA